MKQKLTALRKDLWEHIELYSLFALCCLLFALEILHVVDHQWIDRGILATLLLLALGMRRDRSAEKDLGRRLDSLSTETGRDVGILWYARRNAARADMSSDLVAYSHIVFLGISHRSLHEYLQDCLQTHQELPWESLEVCFASKTLGTAYEGAHFSRHVAEVRQTLASLLTDPSKLKRLPRLKRVKFIQHNGLVSHTGSMFGPDPSDPSVVYVVHSKVYLHGDTNEGLTMRLCAVSENTEIQQMRMAYYKEAYAKLRETALSLGEFGWTPWNESAERFDQYSDRSEILRESIRKLVEFAGIKDHEVVLDLGAGPGNAAVKLLEHDRKISAVLLDASPRMVQLARSRFRSDPRVRIALCRLPGREGEDIDLDNERFTLILIHQSLRELSDSCGGLEQLASWCRGRLQEGGRVVIGAHDGDLKTEPPPGWEQWRDPLKPALLKVLKAYRPLKNPSEPLLRDDVVGAFERQGFSLDDETRLLQHLDFEERRQMWHVPAVMYSLVDIKQVSAEEIATAVDRVVGSLAGQKTMPRTMTYWKFRRID